MNYLKAIALEQTGVPVLERCAQMEKRNTEKESLWDEARSITLSR